MERERRALPLEQVSIRADSGRFIGHASTWERYAIGDPKRYGFLEQFDRRAFDRAIAEEQDVRYLVNHDPSSLLARTASSTMTLATDKRGLRVEATLADTSVGRDLRTLLERGDISHMSIGFVATSDRWESLKSGEELRTVLDVDLFDVSAVTFPANPSTDASLRSAIDAAGFVEIRRQRWAAAQERFNRLTGPRANDERVR